MNRESNLNLGGETTYTRVADKLREEILTGIFEAGERLKVADLSTRYGVSMMPIREALQLLQGEGLIVLEPNKGARVRQIDRHFIENMYDIRSVIEGMLMRKAAARVSREELRPAEAVNKEYESAARQGNWPRALELNKEFHSLLFAFADNPEAVTIIDRHWGLIDCLRRQFGFGSGRSAEAVNEHRQLLKALASHDCEKAELIALRHSLTAKEDMLRRMAATETMHTPHAVKSK